MASLQAGAIRRAFESEEANGEAGSGGKVAQKSSSGARIYRSFMRKNTVEEGEEDDATIVRRSSARPRYWRTAEENAEVARRYDEERRDAVTSAAENMARMTAQPGRTLV